MNTIMIPARIRQVMHEQGVTQSVVAGALGITQAAVSRKLAGTSPITVEQLVEIARVCEVEPGDLYQP